MDRLPACTIAAHFADLPDPRIDRAKRHDLLAIVTIALCGVICGADSWVEIARFGHAKRAWLGRLAPLPNGIPSHDAFGRVFAALDPAAFATAFLGWAHALATATDGGIVAIDGKTLRRSHDRGHDRAALHLVSAWATANHVVLGQVATAERSNEITAIPALFDVLALTDTVVTIDAIGCQTAIAGQIVAGGGDYALTFYSDIFALSGYEDVEAGDIGATNWMLRLPQEDGGTTVALYVQEGPVLYRIGGYSPGGDPTTNIVNVAQGMISQ